MRVLYTNLNVGSAIEHAGNIIKSWILECFPAEDFVEYKVQDTYITLAKLLEKFNPELVITNEDYIRVVIPVYFHHLYSKCKLIHINHVWKYLLSTPTNDNEILYVDFLKNVDKIFCLNQKPEDVKLPDYLENKFYNFYYPTDPSVFNVQIPWEERKKDFFYIGHILPHKLSYEFVKKNDIDIDCYGRKFPKHESYLQLFESNNNIHYCGYVEQEMVPQVMNQYKYLVLPHDGYEPFNWVLLQAMFCGCIPLVVNDRSSKTFDYKWIDWANGLYFGCNSVDQLLINMREIRNRTTYMASMSSEIREKAVSKFSYEKFKSEFIKCLEEIKT